MADRTGIKQRVVELLLDLKDRFSPNAGKAVASADKVDRSLGKIEKSAGKAGGAFDGAGKKIAGGLNAVKVAALAAVAAMAGVLSQVGKWTAAANAQERAETKLATTLRNVTGATDAQVSALIRQAGALQSATGYGDEATISAQAMLGTFQLTAEQIGLLTPVLLDTAEGLRRLGKENIDLEQIATSVGKAYVDGASALKRYGVSLSEAQEEQLKLATGNERVGLLVEILRSNFGGLAETIGSTYEADVRRAAAATGDLDEALGRLALSTGVPQDVTQGYTSLVNSLIALTDAIAMQAEPQSQWQQSMELVGPTFEAATAAASPHLAVQKALTMQLERQGVTLPGVLQGLADWVLGAKGLDPAAAALAQSTQDVADGLALTGDAAANATEQQRMLQAQMEGLDEEAADRLAPSMRALIEEFDAFTAKGKSAADGVQALAADLRLEDAAAAVVDVQALVQGLTELGTASDDTGGKIRITAADVREGLGAALKDVAGGELAEFARQWDAAMRGLDGEPIEAIAGTIEMVLGEALGRLGLDLTSVREGTTAVGRELTGAFEAAAIAAAEDAEIIGSAWDALLGKLGSVEDIELARATLARLGEDGRISLDQLRDATEDLDRAQSRLAATTGDVADAFKRLGVQSSEQLRLIAEEALRDFETIRESGVATTRDIEQAWEAYAERALASGDRVQMSIARQEATVLGLAERYRELTGEKAASADAGERGASAAEREADALERGASAAEAKAAAQSAADEAWRNRRVPVELESVLRDSGARPSNYDSSTLREAERIFQDEMAERTRRNIHPGDLNDIINQAAQSAIALASSRELRLRVESDGRARPSRDEDAALLDEIGRGQRVSAGGGGIA